MSTVVYSSMLASTGLECLDVRGGDGLLRDRRTQSCFCQDKINEETYDERVQSGGVVCLNPCCGYSWNVLGDSDQKTYDPCDATGPVDPRPRSGPSSSRADVVSHHSAADRAKGGGHQAEKPHQVVRDSCDSQKSAYREGGESRSCSRNLRQHRAETVRRDERRKTGWHPGGNGKKEEHHWRQSTHTRDRGGVVVALRSGAAAQIAGDSKDRQSAGDQCSADNTKDTAEENVFSVAIVHSEVSASGPGSGEVSDYDREYI